MCHRLPLLPSSSSYALFVCDAHFFFASIGHSLCPFVVADDARNNRYIRRIKLAQRCMIQSVPCASFLLQSDLRIASACFASILLVFPYFIAFGYRAFLVTYAWISLFTATLDHLVYHGLLPDWLRFPYEYVEALKGSSVDSYAISYFSTCSSLPIFKLTSLLRLPL